MDNEDRQGMNVSNSKRYNHIRERNLSFGAPPIKFTLMPGGITISPWVAKDATAWITSDYEKLFVDVRDHIYNALQIQFTEGVLRENGQINENVMAGMNTEHVQLMFKRFGFLGKFYTLVGILTKVGQWHWSGIVMIDNVLLAETVASNVGVYFSNNRPYESITFLTDHNNDLVKHIRGQWLEYTDDLYNSIKDGRVLVPADDLFLNAEIARIGRQKDDSKNFLEYRDIFKRHSKN